jgi:hypothetical protein
MRKMGWGLVGIAALMVAGSQAADAMGTCTLVKSWCPHELVAKADEHRAPTSVPEPEMLGLLGAGVAAVGAAVLRRRKNSKKD